MLYYFMFTIIWSDYKLILIDQQSIVLLRIEIAGHTDLLFSTDLEI